MPTSLAAAITNAVRNLRYSYMFLPGVIALAFAALAFVLAEIDRTSRPDGVVDVFPAGPGAARSVLATIGATLATVAGVAFSITIVSLQLVSQQFTPRALRNFLGDRLNQTVAGIFIGGFLYCLVALRTIEEGADRFVPGLTVTVAVAIAFVGLAFLLVFVHHMGHSIDVANITKRIADGTLAAAECLYPDGVGRPAEEDPEALVATWRAEAEPVVVCADRPGFVQMLDHIPDTIAGGSFRVEVVVAPGDFVTERHPLAFVWTSRDAEECATALRRAIAVAAERELEQDVRYGVRQLADIAVKALSPSVNDPTTATTCIGYLQAILERLAARGWPARVRRFPEKDVTIVFRRNEFDDYLHALIQIGRYATSDARAVEALLRAALRVAEAAYEAGEVARARATRDAAGRIARRALRSDAVDEEEREAIGAVMRAYPSRDATGAVVDPKRRAG